LSPKGREARIARLRLYKELVRPEISQMQEGQKVVASSPNALAPSDRQILESLARILNANVIFGGK